MPNCLPEDHPFDSSVLTVCGILPENEMYRYAYGGLTPAQRRKVDWHLQECWSCYNDLENQKEQAAQEKILPEVGFF